MTGQAIFIDGHAGTTGLEIREKIAESKLGIKILKIPSAHRKDTNARADFLNEADLAILCLPDGAAREAANLIESDKVKVLDASAAHRTAKGWTYGMPEWSADHADRIAEAKRVSNPGCYAIAAVALLHPLTKAGILNKDAQLSLHGISGYTGGGREMISEFEDETKEVAPARAYALNMDHKHVGEIQKHSCLKRRPLFTPMVGNFPRGKLLQAPLAVEMLREDSTLEDVYQALADHYANSGRVTLVNPEEASKMKHLNVDELKKKDRIKIVVSGNRETGQFLLTAQLDNLGKGSAGTAMQNLELMLFGRERAA